MDDNEFESEFDDALDSDPESGDAYQFEPEDDDLFQFDEDEALSYGEGSDDDVLTATSNPIQKFIEELKDGDPKKLALFAGVGGFIFILTVMFMISVFSGSSDDSATSEGSSSIPASGTLAALPTAPPGAASQQQTTSSDDSSTQYSQYSHSTQPSSTQSTTQQQSTQSSAVSTSTDSNASSTLEQLASAGEQAGERLASLEQVTQSLSTSFSTIEQQEAQNVAQINNMAKGISNIQNQVMQINNMLVSLANEAKKQQQAIEQRKQQAKDDKNAVTNQGDLGDDPAPSVASMGYYVLAVIPGRAWLKDTQGKIVSVAVNDPIPNYGNVTQINAVDGLVTTSSGQTIEYGIDQF